MFKIIGWIIFAVFIVQILMSIVVENNNPMGRVVGASLNAGIAYWLYLALSMLP